MEDLAGVQVPDGGIWERVVTVRVERRQTLGLFRELKQQVLVIDVGSFGGY